jgi:O-antigen/teichoic acid export membrane protein
LSGIAIAIAAPVSIFSRTIMSSYGSGFSEGWGVLVAVAVYSVFWASNIVIGQVLWSTGASVAAMILGAVRAGILLCSFLFLVPKNAGGMALAYIITYGLQTVYQWIIAKKSANRFFLVQSPAPCKIL